MAVDEKANQIKDYSKISDEKLLNLSQSGDYKAFEEFVRRYEDRIYRLGLKMLHSPQDAEDILQKTFLTVYEKMDQFRGESKVSTWVYRIATNHALMKLRKEKKKITTSLSSPVNGNEDLFPQLEDESTDISKALEQKEMVKKLERAISELPDIYRLVFILRDVEGFSNKEVAKMLNLTVPAVKSRIFRARLHLRDKLQELEVKEGEDGGE
ncbi:MAG: RNA polymerase sigma factor [Vulcanimicrobiota bacterium]